MPVPHEKPPAPSPAPENVRPTRMRIATRNVLMIIVGVLVFAIVSGIVLYDTILYGDMVPNFGIVLMLTVPLIAGVAFRVGLDAWLDRGQ
ncbi:hypothetical protein [Paraburkholderia saeva]|jgi:hypothetical protein|uniref:Uncharacterized protein n=1 Tax=Paraburkholderia saeva TaxID=2777537 RepID=A0A9N8X435_9BURK|nr:hypothetical protein [Paraburkholderia saeva]CAG4909230.1 hypothetical protein R52603_03705 [Paraburkholderia saeva]CAG4926547.1 hypothetical protein LMG31841_05595 [Paraburkholderia saeva]